MRMVFTDENRFIAANARNILEAHGIAVALRNEYSSSAVGEVSPFDTWMQVWVMNDADYDAACKIIASSLSKVNAPPWKCPGCNEENDVAFELCWNCLQEKPP